MSGRRTVPEIKSQANSAIWRRFSSALSQGDLPTARNLFKSPGSPVDLRSRKRAVQALQAAVWGGDEGVEWILGLAGAYIDPEAAHTALCIAAQEEQCGWETLEVLVEWGAPVMHPFPAPPITSAHSALFLLLQSLRLARGYGHGGQAHRHRPGSHPPLTPQDYVDKATVLVQAGADPGATFPQADSVVKLSFLQRLLAPTLVSAPAVPAIFTSLLEGEGAAAFAPEVADTYVAATSVKPLGLEFMDHREHIMMALCQPPPVWTLHLFVTAVALRHGPTAYLVDMLGGNVPSGVFRDPHAWKEWGVDQWLPAPAEGDEDAAERRAVQAEHLQNADDLFRVGPQYHLFLRRGWNGPPRDDLMTGRLPWNGPTTLKVGGVSGGGLAAALAATTQLSIDVLPDVDWTDPHWAGVTLFLHRRFATECPGPIMQALAPVARDAVWGLRKGLVMHRRRTRRG